ncbi:MULTISPECIES: hypothetical protein [Natronococcus]|uniref:Uncharacterized protein n=1 Tax=Natronococcus jeotgali DSM 18795 TaxID=1227498 RepID=L9XX59_9EURY|nr:MULTISPECIES: hypothetical protein [Natronococcus]ELY66365.1 hypothetical protein C492_00534 [Natronococcus jeotgali DSM 18795]NKE37769.1 hypothetical protein [Natronococcus sp. JC468]
MGTQNTSAEASTRNLGEEILSRLSRSTWAKQFLIEAVVDETGCDHETVLEVFNDLENRGRIYTFNGVVKRT